MRTVSAALLLLVVLIPAATLVAKDDPKVILSKGQALLEAGDPVAAATLFESVIETRASLDETTQALFYLGRAYEQQATIQLSREEELLTRAAQAYEKLIAASPNLGPAFNNGAQVYARLGKPEQADSWFKRAIDTEGELQPFFLTNYAAFLVENGRWPEAVPFYEQALARNPANTAAEEGLLALRPGPQIAEHLWKLVEQGSYDRAQKLALDQLERNLEAPSSRSILGVVAVTLAEQRMRADDFDASPVAARLGALTRTDSIRDGIRELRRLYDGAALDPAAYKWWKNSEFRSPPAYDSSAAFARLARELGTQHRDTAPEVAERYLKLAVDISRGSDPEALIAIADLYYAGNRIEELKRFADDYGAALFEGKGRAYRDGDLLRIYRFHVALGTMYGRLGWVGSANDPKSAIFQLEHAQSTAKLINARKAEGEAKLVLDPRVVDLLATSYKRAEPRTKKDIQLRLDAASEYVLSGRTASAARVLEPVGKEPRLEQGDQIRYEQLRNGVAVVPPKNESSSGRESPDRDFRIDPNMANRVMPVVTVPRVTVHIFPPAQRTNVPLDLLAELLSDYYSAPKDQRSDLMQKLQGFGVVTLEEGLVTVKTTKGNVALRFTTGATEP